jgi:hypothetical protein
MSDVLADSETPCSQSAKLLARDLSEGEMGDLDARQEFLLRMYSELWANISRHIIVVWQSVTAVLGGGALFALAGRGVLSIDLATTLFLVVVAWSLGHLMDASAWFNRNLHIASNIERIFLGREDLQRVHFYFAEPRRGSMIEHFRLQRVLGVTLMAIILLVHFFGRVWPHMFSAGHRSEALLGMPYIVAGGAVIALVFFGRRLQQRYALLLEESPGEPL